MEQGLPCFMRSKKTGFRRWRFAGCSTESPLIYGGISGVAPAAYSTFTVPIAPRPNCHGLYISSTYTAGCR